MIIIDYNNTLHNLFSLSKTGGFKRFYVLLMCVSFLLLVFMNAAIPIAAVLTVGVRYGFSTNSSWKQNLRCALLVVSFSYST